MAGAAALTSSVMVYTYNIQCIMPLESIYFSMFETEESRDLGQKKRLKCHIDMTSCAMIEIHLVLKLRMTNQQINLYTVLYYSTEVRSLSVSSVLAISNLRESLVLMTFLYTV